MRLSWYSYWPTDPRVTLEELKSQLPEGLRNELLSAFPHADEGICVDVTRPDTVAKLERVLTDKGKILRTLHVEVDRMEHAAYSYFTIDPLDLQWQEGVFFEATPQKCHKLDDLCPWGRAIVPPVAVTERYLSPLLFARLATFVELSIILVVSANLRRVFDSEKVSGLEYSLCQIRSRGGRTHPTDEYYVARVSHRVTEMASDIIPGQNCCPEHLTVAAPYVFDGMVARSNVAPFDFAAINAVRVHDRVYHYYQPQWVVSRKVLDLLLTHHVPGLRRLTLYLTEVFKPFSLS